jgi:hypothetical protein
VTLLVISASGEASSVAGCPDSGGGPGLGFSMGEAIDMNKNSREGGETKNVARAILFVLPALAAMLSVSCGKHGAQWKGTIVEENGVTIAKNPKEPMFNGEVLTLAEELALGGEGAGQEYTFSEVRDIAVDEAEKIYVLDSKESQVKVFGPDGKYLMTMGKKGEGPGEMDRPRALSLNSRELMVLGLNRRLSFFSLDGEPRRSLSTKEIWALYAEMDSQGDIVITEGLVAMDSVTYRIKKFDGRMNFLRELASSPAPNSLTGFDPFMPIHYWLIDRHDNVIYGYPERYEIQVLSPQGKLLKKICRDYDPVAVSEKEKEEEKEDAPAELKFSFSKYHSAYSRFTVDDEDRLFVRTWERPENGDTYFYDVFDPQGRYLAKILLPKRPVIIKKNKLYSVEEDEEGYQAVKRCKITWKL